MLKLNLKVKASCPQHPRYNPQKEGRAPSGDFPCAGCDDLYVIHLYSKVIAKRVNHLSGVHPKDTYDYTYKPAAKEEPKLEPKALKGKPVIEEDDKSRHKETCAYQRPNATPGECDCGAIELEEIEPTPIKEDAPVIEGEVPAKRKRGRPRKEVA
jgi:hypothetical protein